MLKFWALNFFITVITINQIYFVFLDKGKYKIFWSLPKILFYSTIDLKHFRTKKYEILWEKDKELHRYINEMWQ